jgi:hypothetical protein
MFMRIYHKAMGGHIHMRVFVGEAHDMTLGKAGDLCMRREEFDWWRDAVQRHGIVEFRCEPPNVEAKGDNP